MGHTALAVWSSTNLANMSATLKNSSMEPERYRTMPLGSRGRTRYIPNEEARRAGLPA